MSGELYGLSGPGQRIYQAPPAESGGDRGSVADLGSIFGEALVAAIQGVFSGDGPLSLISQHQFEVQQNTQDTQQQLEGINARGVACIPNAYSESSGTSFKRARFHEQVGPLVNMGHDTSTGELILLTRGAYEASTRMQFSWVTLTDARVYCDIVVRDPSGNQFYRAPFVEKTPDVSWIGPIPQQDNYQTISHATNFTVPGPGYRVSVEVKAGTGRGILTGYGLTEFVVNKWSSETS